MIGLRIGMYFRDVILRCMVVYFAAFIIPVFLKHYLEETVWTSILVCAVSVISACVCSFGIGMTSSEKKTMLNRLKVRLGEK